MNQQQPQQQQVVAPYSPGTSFEVQDTPEFQRVLALPRRDWEAAAKHNDLYLRMTQAYKQREGTQELRLIQAAALADAHDMRGLLAPIRVGEGKTALSFLLATVIQGVKRPCLLLPSGLIEKTWIEFSVGRYNKKTGFKEDPLRKHWVCHPAFITRKSFDRHVISYESLSRDSGKEKLNDLRPDLIIADEVHKLRNPLASCTKKVWRFMVANPTTMFCGMSATITKRSIQDYWHLAFWALRHNMPLPRTDAETEKWAEAIDEKKNSAIARRQGGVLLQFCSPEEIAEINPIVREPATLGHTRTAQMPEMQFQAKLVAARKGYQRRLRETPGIICSPNRNLDCGLIMQRLDVVPGHEVQMHLETLREKPWTTPNGDLLTMPTEVWRHARTLACGFYYRWEPPPPDDWMSARRTWNWTVTQVLDPEEGMYYNDYRHLNLDSPMQVALALSTIEAREERVYLYHDDDAVRLDANGEEMYEIRQVSGRAPTIIDPNIRNAYHRWVEIRNTYKINSVAEWIDDSMLRYCLDWMSRNGPAIVFTEHKAFGLKLAEMSGTGFCANGGLDANGVAIEDYNGKIVVASVKSNSEGRNLQAWNKMLIVTVSPTGALVEQLIGRMHRPGQPEDTVYVDWICACEEQDRGFDQMLADARYIQDSTGYSQKLLIADHV